jgi:hypothetical protein
MIASGAFVFVWAKARLCNGFYVVAMDEYCWHRYDMGSVVPKMH